MSKTIQERFWPKVAVNPGCWEWKGHKGRDGYGYIRPSSTANIEAAHRVSYRLANGEIPAGMMVRHTCDNRICVNPEHLVVGTHADNMADKVERKRQLFGERHNMVKLTEEQARAILKDARKTACIAVEYGVSKATVDHIRSGKRWRHLRETM